MSIQFDASAQVFHLRTPTSSYVMQVRHGRYLAHLGWFSSLREWRGSNDLAPFDRPFSPNPGYDDRSFSLDTCPQEYPSAGRGDFRNPAIEVTFANGSSNLDLWYDGHRILPGKPALEGLPSTYCESADEADTLEIDLADPVSLLSVTLVYTVWRDRDAICRSARVANRGTETVLLRKVLSASVDFAESSYTLLQLSGAHCRERKPWFRPLVPGLQGVESRRGASSGQQHPFIALLGKNAGEKTGEAFGFSLVYSGNFVATAEVDQFDGARVSAGINPFNFSWNLAPGSSFSSPELVMVRSGSGLGAMSRTCHDLYRDRLCRGAWRSKVRPVLVNNWEATYFDFDEKKIFALAEKAKDAGLDLLVLDDGWFGRRDDDKSSLGDWFTDMRKLPNGLKGLADGVNARGLSFGLWVEPEMISERSVLFRAHPDWCLHADGRRTVYGRDQFVLDYSRKDVQDYIIETLTGVFSGARVSYVKWDMNRHIVETSSSLAAPENQIETSHRYILGLYRVLGEITSAFPDILFESCSGGGGRYDPGMLYYMPQTWASDNTDAISRVAIQEGTLLVYPASTMSCHVSAVPNHQLGRTTSLATRGSVAMAGVFGYELDLTKLPEGEIAGIAEQVSLYKSVRETILFGDLYRLRSVWEDSAFASWMNVSKDKKSAVLTLVWLFPEANQPVLRLQLDGLDPDILYRLDDGREIRGDELMASGLRFPQGNALKNSLQLRLSAV